MTRAQIAELVEAHRPQPTTSDGWLLAPTEAELETAALALADAFPDTPWLIEERKSAMPGGRPTHHGTVVCNTRFARRKLGLS